MLKMHDQGKGVEFCSVAVWAMGAYLPLYTFHSVLLTDKTRTRFYYTGIRPLFEQSWIQMLRSFCFLGHSLLHYSHYEMTLNNFSLHIQASNIIRIIYIKI